MPGIIDGRDWLSARRAFLQAELAKETSDDGDHHDAMVAELATIEHELAVSRRHWWRRLLWGLG